VLSTYSTVSDWRFPAKGLRDQDTFPD
jgi:hypothetical protein